MTKRNMHPEDIKALLGKRGLNFAILAEIAGNGMTRQRLAQALVRPNRQSEEVIAEALKMTPAQIWPERFHPNGLRKTRQPARLYKPIARFRRVSEERKLAA